MKKICLFLIIVSFSLLVGIPLGMAQDVSNDVETTAEVSELQNVDNKICPVSGEKIKEEEKFQVEYEGKIYNLCCKMCAKDFKKNPEKYIEKLEEIEGEHKEGMHHHEGHPHEH